MTSMWKKIVGKKDRSSKDYSDWSPPPHSGLAAYVDDYSYSTARQDDLDSFRGEPATSAAVDYDRTPPRHPIHDHPNGGSDWNRIDTSASAAVVDYDRRAPPVPDAFSPSKTSASAFAVEYQRTPPVPQPPGYNNYNPRPMTNAPTTYRVDPPSSAGDRRPTNAPVQYRQSGPVSPEAVFYPRSQPAPPELKSGSDGPVSPPMVEYPYGQPPASLDAFLASSPKQKQPSELPAYSAPKLPPRPPPVPYRSPENASPQRPRYNQEHEWVPPQPPRNEYRNEHNPRIENAVYGPTSDNSSASSLYDPPYTAASASTAPTSYPPSRNLPSPGNQYPPPQPARQPQKFAANTEDDGDDPNVSKFAARIFCQRKREEGDTREEYPRDIREFRLANLALIKLSAGRERHVLLDAVFGELDKQIAPLLEKHWYVTPQTRVQDCSIAGSNLASKIGPIKVAYKGDASVLYIEFSSPEEYSRFRTELTYAMNTISG
ncbi:hypothetical protein TWF696_007681 [Orbilia brochopaga]|uniref:Uncharacterized protein n=1 Tax=Orbilia brochopaga TaxID=3140254 RepID=A0AAV9UM16_9PEZI